MTPQGAKKYLKLKAALERAGQHHARLIDDSLRELIGLQSQIEALRRKQIATAKEASRALNGSSQAVQLAFPEDGTDDWFADSEDFEQDRIDGHLQAIPDLPITIEDEDPEAVIEELKTAMKDTKEFLKAVQKL